MLRRICEFVVVVMGFCVGIAFATPANPANGIDYLTLPSKQPVQTSGKKVEVIEFFMYHCPACYAFEPQLLEWVKQQEDKITFRRIHMPLTGPKDPEAHLFLTLDEMGLETSMHDKVLKLYFAEHGRLRNDNDNLEWALRNGLDKEKFLDVYNSFSVLTKLAGLTRTMNEYRVDSTPTLVVDGHYLTNPSMVSSKNPSIPSDSVYSATFQVLNALVAKAGG